MHRKYQSWWASQGPYFVPSVLHPPSHWISTQPYEASIIITCCKNERLSNLPNVTHINSKAKISNHTFKHCYINNTDFSLTGSFPLVFIMHYLLRLNSPGIELLFAEHGHSTGIMKRVMETVPISTHSLGAGNLHRVGGWKLIHLCSSRPPILTGITQLNLNLIAYHSKNTHQTIDKIWIDVVTYSLYITYCKIQIDATQESMLVPTLMGLKTSVCDDLYPYGCPPFDGFFWWILVAFSNLGGSWGLYSLSPANLQILGQIVVKCINT